MTPLPFARILWGLSATLLVLVLWRYGFGAFVMVVGAEFCFSVSVVLLVNDRLRARFGPGFTIKWKVRA